ncbi:glycolate oxidase subunit GlcE [Roseovarius faecimaris]|uniref:Glycolate oxidase subunit GlcE n=1 Tax=Roseovarius faecimaris TaxID=2494550 RepID=A0A6I6ITM1_9RHOB|nr:glycolate oxidase subunit GlcE [Roseovarius faecimaris]QGY00460.1 glycolate oxidase subunit GlcE [Roseovarius faecimaris]
MEPRNEEELANIVAGASAPMRIEGGGTRPIGHVTDAPVLSTRGLSGITLYEPGALTLVAQAGTPLAEAEAALAAEGQRLAFEPMDHRALLGTSGAPTLGGMVAANVSGPRRIQVGACRDSLLGVRFVDGRGQVIRNGGRVMKNVTGYDLVKLMAGSYGTLGVLTEVALKVLPIPAATGVLLFEGLSDERAVSALSRALRSPFEVTGAAHTQKGLDGAPVTMIRLEGSEASVAYRADRLTAELSEFGSCALETDPENTKAGWTWVRDVAPFHGRDGTVWRLSVKPTEAPAIVAALTGAEALYDWGGGLIWLFCPAGCGVDGRRIRAALAEHSGGHATLIRGDDPHPFQPLAEPLQTLQTGLRARFDPRGLFNPGRMGQAA